MTNQQSVARMLAGARRWMRAVVAGAVLLVAAAAPAADSPAKAGNPGWIHEAPAGSSFPHCIEAGKLLGIDEDFRAKLEAALKRIPPYQINRLVNELVPVPVGVGVPLGVSVGVSVPVGVLLGVCVAVFVGVVLGV